MTSQAKQQGRLISQLLHTGFKGHRPLVSRIVEPEGRPFSRIFPHSVVGAHRHPWSHLSPVVTLVNCGHTCHRGMCVHVQISKDLHNTILVTFPREVTNPGNSLCLGNYFYQEDSFPRKSCFSGSSISWDITYPRKSHIPRRHFSWEVTFPQKFQFLVK